MTDSIASPTNPGLVAQPIVSHMQLLAIELMTSSSVRFPELDERGKFDVPIEEKHNVIASYHEQERRVIAAVQLEVNAQNETAKLASWTAVYRLVYQVTGDFKDDRIKEQAEAFCQTYTLAHAWPYWREHLASQSIRMGLPCILAPILVVGATPVVQPAIPAKPPIS